MSSTISRRKLLRTGGQALIAGGVALCGSPALEAKSSSKSSAKGVDYYQKLGVTPLISFAADLAFTGIKKVGHNGVIPFSEEMVEPPISGTRHPKGK